VKYADNPARRSRTIEEYKRRLREAKTGKQARGVIAEICAEGGIAVGGIPELAERFAEFWRWLNGDWREARDVCLMASALNEERQVNHE
jgi:CRISPR-associated protein Cas8a1/Csx13